MADAFDLFPSFLPLVEKQSAFRRGEEGRDVGNCEEVRDFKALKEGEEEARYRRGRGWANPDGGLHDATTSGEGRLTKHVPSFVCENQKRLCATNMRATTRPYNWLAASPLSLGSRIVSAF